MNRRKPYYADIEVTESKTYTKRVWFSSTDDETAETFINDQIDKNSKSGFDFTDSRYTNKEFKLVGLDSVEDYDWKTRYWRDLEKLHLEELIQYNNRSEEQIKNGEGDHWIHDANDYLKLALLLEEKKYEEAYDFYCSLDTWLRDAVPERIGQLFTIVLQKFD